MCTSLSHYPGESDKKTKIIIGLKCIHGVDNRSRKHLLTNRIRIQKGLMQKEQGLVTAEGNNNFYNKYVRIF